jgi:hypothetical protein
MDSVLAEESESCLSAKPKSENGTEMEGYITGGAREEE